MYTTLYRRADVYRRDVDVQPASTDWTAASPSRACCSQNVYCTSHEATRCEISGQIGEQRVAEDSVQDVHG